MNKKFHLLIILICGVLSLSLAGCNETTDTSSSGGSTTGSTASSTSGGGTAFPVNPEKDTTINVKFEHETDRAKDTEITYFRIMKEYPISLYKEAGSTTFGTYQIGATQASLSADGTEFSVPTITATGREVFTATTNNSNYDSQIFLERENFKGIRIVLNDREAPAEVVAAKVKNPSMSGSDMSFYDIFLQVDRENLLAEKTDRGWLVPLTLTEALEDCGQLTASVDPEAVTEQIALGGSTTDSSVVKAKKYPPDNIGPITKDDIDKLIKLNPTQEALIRKLIDPSIAGNPYLSEFRQVTQVEQFHTLTTGLLTLSAEILKIPADTYFSSGAKMTLLTEQTSADKIGSPLIQIVKDGKTTVYGPQIAVKVTKSTSGTQTSNLQIGSTEPVAATNTINGDPWCGYTPESKPAIYLYPKIPMPVSVQLNPKNGYITKSIPFYKNSWNVLALPNGYVISGFKKYPHLFYEAMLPTPEMPQSYAVLDGSKMYDELYSLGKKLSLTEREATELAQYWNDKLPASKFYQVGLMEKDKIEEIEPLDIVPRPTSQLRIRLVFKALQEQITPTFSDSTNFERKGFTLVEWGGFVLN